MTVTAIRDLPAARWQSAAYAALVIRLREVLRGTERPIAAYHKDTPRATKSMSRLLLVAYAYRLNVAAGMRDPVATIAREYQVKPSTAASWVFRARKAGLIGPAAGRTAGEAPQHRRSEK
ncbi:MAG TPA: hypothetical protein VES36_05580 [Candidatus Limnocylindrales bacterium]|nr:hypothetical protein [Candidatus Limnocylindrales bacterium]